jgi:uncharacterized membrane protein YdjX (TVP38/TMEM64 family)
MLKVTRAVTLQLLGLVVLGLLLLWVSHHFPLVDTILRAQRRIGQMELWSGFVFPLFYALCNVLLLPAGVLSISSGLFFGLWWGTLLALTGNVLGAAIAFLISRNLGRAWVEKKVLQKRKWIALDEAVRREGGKIVFLSQVHPLFPTSLLNYIYGITSIGFWKCMLWVAIGQAPGLFLYAYLGTLGQLGIKLLRGKTHPTTVEYFIWFGGLLITLLVTMALGRVALRMLSAFERTTSTETPVNGVSKLQGTPL